MIPFLLRRAVSALPTLLGVSLLAFLILNALPSDPLLPWSGGSAPLTAEARALLVARSGAGRPAPERYAGWLLATLSGDLGTSLRDGRPVVSAIGAALPFSVLLGGSAVLVVFGLAIPLGLFGAARPGSVVDRAGGLLLLGLYALPPFAAALLLQQTFAVRLGILPLQGVTDARDAAAGAAGLAAPLRHLVLPAACLALTGLAFVARYARALFRSRRAREFHAAARARGASEPRAWGHVAANAAVPLLALLSAVLPGIVGGSVLIEQIFSWPGVGRLYLASIEARDEPMVLALTLLAAAAVLCGQILSDLLSLAVDPQMRDRLLEWPADA